jgi:hypothetical protein
MYALRSYTTKKLDDQLFVAASAMARTQSWSRPYVALQHAMNSTPTSCNRVYPHERWTTRLLARHAREHGLAEGHACLANQAQGTVCKILDQEEVKPHKVRYYLERRDPDFAEKMVEVLCVYLAR